jgi:hypothetical protein
MTLILSYQNINGSVLAVDRRLSLSDLLFDDLSTKCIYLDAADARLAVAYTGIAYVGPDEGQQRTDLWLARTFVDMRAPSLRANQVVRGLQARLQDVLALTPGGWQQKGLTVVGVGILGARSRTPVQWVVSNQIDEHGAGPRTPTNVVRRKWWIPRSPNPQSGRNWGAAFPGFLRLRFSQQIDSGIFERLSLQEVATELVNMIREASRDSSSQGLIGQNCLAILVPRDGEPTSVDHPFGEPLRRRGCHVVKSKLVLFDSEIRVVEESPSSVMPVEQWPTLPARVDVGLGLLTVCNDDCHDWSVIHIHLNGEPNDYQAMVRGDLASSGYLYELPVLVAGASTTVGLQAFHRGPGQQHFFSPAAGVRFLTITARRDDRLYGVFRWSAGG